MDFGLNISPCTWTVSRPSATSWPCPAPVSCSVKPESSSLQRSPLRAPRRRWSPASNWTFLLVYRCYPPFSTMKSHSHVLPSPCWLCDVKKHGPGGRGVRPLVARRRITTKIYFYIKEIYLNFITNTLNLIHLLFLYLKCKCNFFLIGSLVFSSMGLLFLKYLTIQTFILHIFCRNQHFLKDFIRKLQIEILNNKTKQIYIYK